MIVNVPDVPGVPSVNFAAGASDGIELLVADVIAAFTSPAQAQWGIFLNGQPVVVADNVISFDFKQERILSTFPQEDGAFSTYDKVRVPYDARFQFSAGGSEANRQALLDSVEAIVDDLNLYDAVSPEKVYSSCNVVHYSYRRSARNGAAMIVVDVWLLQVPVTASATLSSAPQSPSAAAQENGGTVAPTAPTGDQVQKVNAGGGIGAQ